MKIEHFTDLDVYRVAFQLQLAIFEESKKWPGNEDYSLTDQIRRASRSVGANLAEAWAKRRYAAHFLSKLTDADGELQETYHWLCTARQCGYLTDEKLAELVAETRRTGRLLGAMIKTHESFCN